MTAMTTIDEQAEARRLELKRKQYPRIKRVMRRSASEKRFRLFRILFMRGLGPGYGAPDNYSAKVSVAIEWQPSNLWVGAFRKGGRDERTLLICLIPCVPIRVHYKRSYGGWCE